MEVRSARSWAAHFSVPAAAAQELIDPAGLKVGSAWGRAFLTLAFVDYLDSDLGRYHEVAVAFFVQGPAGRGVYIHRLPVDERFTLAAGREIWGYPKVMADIAIEVANGATRCRLALDGNEQLSLTVRRGVIPAPQPAMPTYTRLDGVTRVTRWRMQGRGKVRPGGGATVELGSGEIADELRALGLPKRARAVSTVESYRASFGPAEIL